MLYLIVIIQINKHQSTQNEYCFESSILIDFQQSVSFLVDSNYIWLIGGQLCIYT